MNTKSCLSCFALRLHPGEDLVKSLLAYVEQQNIKAASILTCVGSLTQARLRLAGTTSVETAEYLNVKEKVEIVSLVGTLSSLGGSHLHISLSDEKGKVVGGHLMPDDAIVHTTVELVIGSCDDLSFTREFDEKTGFDELEILRS